MKTIPADTYKTILSTALSRLLHPGQAMFKARIEHIRRLSRKNRLKVVSGWYSKDAMKKVLQWDKYLVHQ